MRDSTFEITFCEKYNLVADEYDGISVTTLPFSVRVINRFMGNGISTVAALLKSSPSTLMKIKGFGANCLEEVDAYCSKLNENDFKPVEQDLKVSKCVSPLFYKHREDIALGNFSVFENYELSDDESKMLQRYQEAYGILDENLVFDCINSTDKILPLIEMLSDFQNRMKRHIEILGMASSLPLTRKHNKAFGYINAFTLDENERSLLKSVCESEETSLILMSRTDKVEDTSIYILLKRFFKWCAFNLKEEVNDLFSNLYSNEKVRTVIQLRARKQTLEQIGSTLGVTRERVRQIEAKAKRIFSRRHSRIRIISKIAAERNGDTVLTPVEIENYCGEHTLELLFLLQTYESANYTYDRQLDVFVVGDDSITGRVQSSVESLPDIVKANQLNTVLSEAAEESDIPLEMLEKAFLDAYRLTGEVYHRYRLSLATIYERVLDAHYPQGFKAYDSNEIRRFREIIANEYGDVGLPANDHALTSRVASICILCGKGIYRLKKNDYLPRQLANKICDYIENNENTIFLTNTLFSIFEDELLSVGIDNKYFLQGVLHEQFADKFVFRRDYISKDADVTSVYSAVVDFIKKSNFPVSKAQIQEAFPGITEIVINLSVSDPNILNYFGEYLHASKLNILETEKYYLLSVVETLVADGEAHHGRELYEVISNEKPEILTRNAAMYPFSAFSIIEFLFRDRFQFSRPFFAMNGIEIDRPAERLHDLIYSNDKFTVTEISEFGRENHFQIYSLLEYVNDCNDEFLLIDDDTMMKIGLTGIDENIANQVENIILNSISETTPIKNLSIWGDLPSINVPWTEWLIYSVIFKWGTKLLSATSSNQFRLSVPLVAPIDNYDPAAFKDMDKGDSSYSFVADDLSDMDALLEDIIDFNVLGDNL